MALLVFLLVEVVRLRPRLRGRLGLDLLGVPGGDVGGAATADVSGAHARPAPNPVCRSLAESFFFFLNLHGEEEEKISAGGHSDVRLSPPAG